jgi:uncharacterized delta-60 repeat protein
VDDKGKVYVAGTTEGIGTSEDSTTIKYKGNGKELWVARYDGPASGADEGQMDIDGDGNTYVSGTSENASEDIATIKYDTDGNELWVVRYDGPANGTDEVENMMVDDLGNVYVVGGSEGIGTSNDCVTIKYNTDGTELWVARYNGPVDGGDYLEAVAVDSSGNVYVGGLSENISEDFVIIKYDSDGNELWVAHYDGPGNGTDEVEAMTVDSSGNVYVTGESEGVTSIDIATIKYGTNGNRLWVTHYNGPASGEDGGRSIAVDGSGNSYVAGISEGVGTSEDGVVIKYDSSGNQAPIIRYNGPANGEDVFRRLMLDDSGDIYVVGWSEGIGTSEDGLVAKYDSAGNELWMVRYDGPAGGEDRFTSIALGHPKNIYVSGRSEGVDTSEDGIIVKYR